MFRHKPRVVILSSSPITDELKRLLSNPFYSRKVFYVEGSALSGADLEVVDARNAQQVIILADPLAEDKLMEDDNNILRLWSVQSVTSSTVEVFIQLLCDESRDRLMSLPAAFVKKRNVLCVSEFKSVLAARSCLYPGLTTLVTNLFRRGHNSLEPSLALKASWIQDYEIGCCQQLYVKKLSSIYHGRSFVEVANVIYSFWGVLCIGVLVESEEETNETGERRSEILLNPGAKYRVGKNDRVIVIASDEEKADELQLELSELLMNPKEPLPKEFEPLGLQWSGKSPLKEEKQRKRLESKIEMLKKKQEDLEKSARDLKHKISKKQGVAFDVDDSSSGEESGESDVVHRTEEALPFVEKLAEVERRAKSKLGLSSYLVPASRRKSVFPTTEQLDADGDESISEKRTSLETCTIRKRCRLREHIIVTGDLSSLLPFVQQLRSSLLRDHRPILVLSENISTEKWAEVSLFDNIWYMQGTALNPEVLIKANFSHAYKVVIFSEPSHHMAAIDSNFIDSNAIFSCLNLAAQCNYDMADKVVVELISTSNMNFLDLKTRLYIETNPGEVVPELRRHLDENDWAAPIFAAGSTMCTASLFHFLLANTHDNPETINIANLLIGTERSSSEEPSSVVLLPIPKMLSHVDKELAPQYTFQDLYRVLTNEVNVIPLGIRRVASIAIHQTVHPFICTNPAPNFLLEPTDLVYCLVPNHRLSDPRGPFYPLDAVQSVADTEQVDKPLPASSPRKSPQKKGKSGKKKAGKKKLKAFAARDDIEMEELSK